MKKSQTILLRMSELREKLNALNSLEELTEEQRSEQEQHINEYNTLEGQYRQEVRAEDILDKDRLNPEPIQSDKPEVREFNEIYHQARLTHFVDHIANGVALEGADAEFRAAIFGAEDDEWARGNRDASFPIHLLMPVDRDMEVRDDVATVVDADTGVRTTHPIMQRIFRRTDAAYLGANFLMVSAGQSQFPYVSEGASLVYVDEGGDVEAARGRIVVETVDPVEARMQYAMGLTSRLRFPGDELEGAFRTDAAMAIEDGIDQTVLRGQAARAAAAGDANTPGAGALSAGNAITGLYPAIDADANAAADLTGLSFLQEYASRVDGRYAYTWMDSRMLVNPEVYQAAIFAQVANNSGRLVSDMLGPDMLRASARLPANDNNRRSQGISYAPMNDRMEWKVPTWQDVMVTVDDITGAGRGMRFITFNLAHNNLILRKQPWRRHSFQVPA